MTQQLKITVGGCVYRSMVHVAHSSSVAQLMAMCADIGGVDVRLHYQHTSNLPQGRSLWLRHAMGAGSDFAISIDSDTGFDAKSLLRCVADVRMRTVSIAVAPVVRESAHGISLNVFSAQGRPMSPSDCHAKSSFTPPLWAGGFGLAAFNLDWFRETWSPSPEPFGEPVEWIYQGEDIQMCRSVVKRGGTVVPMWVPTVHHDSTGYSVIGGRIAYHNGSMIAE